MKLALTMIMVLAAGSFLPAQAFPGGGWDANDARLSMSSGSKLLAPQGQIEAFPRGGWDGNDAKLSVSASKLLPQAK